MDATVERVEMPGSAVDGVSGTLRSPEGARPFRVRSPLVVVAAGALRTPLILQRSGVTHPGIGRNLRLHPTVAVAVRMPQPVDMWKGPTQAARSLQFWRPGPADGVGIGGAHGGFVIESAPAHPGLIAAAQPWEGGAAELEAMEGSRFSAPLIGIVRDHGAGRVRSSRGGWPRIEYRLDDRDGATARRALIEMARMARAAGAVEIVALATPGLRWRATDGRPAFDAFCRGLGRLSVAPNRASLFSAHQMGSARAGADPRLHPSDPHGRVRVDTEGRVRRGLYVGDASLFPTAAGVNPMLTVMAMAERTARAVLADRVAWGSAKLREDLCADPLEPRRVATPRTLKMMCCTPASQQRAEALDDLAPATRARGRSTAGCCARSPRTGRPSRSQCSRRTAYLCAHALRPAEDVAGIRVLGHQAQRLPLPAAADHDRHPGPADGLRRVEQARRRDVRALEWPPPLPLPPDHISCAMRSVSSSHSKRSPQRRHREPEPGGLLLVPGRTDPEPGTPAGQDVERGGGLDPEAGCR